MHAKLADPNKKTLGVLSRYEHARLIGTRAEMLQKGHPSTLVEGGHALIPDARRLAEAELARGDLDGFIVARPLRPGGEYEYWRVGDLRRVAATGFSGAPLSTSSGLRTPGK